jgi:hypothetical protein
VYTIRTLAPSVHPRRARPLARALRRSLGAALVLPAFAVTLAAQESFDRAAIEKLKDEGHNRSQVMEITSWLTNVYGGRLTGAPSTRDAGEWTVKKLTEWGLVNAKLEPWGPFGRGWVNERFVAQVTSPYPFTIIGYANAWTPGTNGEVHAGAVYVEADSVADLEKYRGKLRGKLVFASPPRDVEAHFEPLGHRYTDEELAELSQPPEPRPARGAPDANAMSRFAAMRALAAARTKFFVDEGALAIVNVGRGDGGTVFVSGSGGSRDPENPAPLPQLTFAVEHYNRIVRTLQHGVPVSIDIDVRNRFYDDNLNSFNIVAEIPGTDPQLKDEIVMLGAHFDSWQAGTGATDNASGSAVMMEAVRLIKATGLQPKRTIRIALWTGEEEGLLGSRAYVAEHFADRADMKLKPAHSKFSAYFNVDNGTGAIRGVYQQGNEAVGPIFKAWMEPFADHGMKTLTMRNTGGTDHLAFDAVGLPGFQFIQDPVEYGTRTHHSNMDTFERIQVEDMKHNAVVLAGFVYNAAQRAEKLPRKPLPTTSDR